MVIKPHRSISTLCFASLLFLAPAPTSAYKLSSTGQADIGAYHVQPGRCSAVESRLGATHYANFFSSSPSHTTFTQLFPESHTPSSSSTTPPDTDSMDATSLCAYNPDLTSGYGGGFDSLKLYLVYSRCLYGTNDMRVLCGAIDASGKPLDEYNNLIQATCPKGTKCKNLCANMRDPSLTSKYAAKQVQLAQCVDEAQWQRLTDMYSPDKSPAVLGKEELGLVTPIAGSVLVGDPGAVEGAEEEEDGKKPDDAKKPDDPKKPDGGKKPDDAKKPDPAPATGAGTGSGGGGGGGSSVPLGAKPAENPQFGNP